ncbi:hypothetical protein BDV97DRAFT_394443 [Delphinella strobiligena]|nr:hypothetical protein BDV97DRAFT_394443 [Delphinella strobiligena]
MDDQPPPYEARKGADREKPLGHWSYSDELTVSRSQHIAATVSKIQAVLATRARYGISRSTLLLVPRGQIDLSRRYEIVELENVKHMSMELNGEADSEEFWLQPQAVLELKGCLLDRLSGGQTGRPGQMKAEVRLKECHFRRESDFGLMETTAAACIIIDLEA